MTLNSAGGDFLGLSAVLGAIVIVAVLFTLARRKRR